VVARESLESPETPVIGRSCHSVRKIHERARGQKEAREWSASRGAVVAGWRGETDVGGPECTHHIGVGGGPYGRANVANVTLVQTSTGNSKSLIRLRKQ
jgi:hypothetical protein